MKGVYYGTPVENHVLNNRVIKVKRDDLAGRNPAPPLGKLRGFAELILSRRERIIAVADRSSASRTGWAVAYICAMLGRRCEIWARVRDTYQLRAEELGASVHYVGHAVVNVYDHVIQPDDCYLIPDDCYLDALINDTHNEVERTGIVDMEVDNIVVSAGSGGLALGLMEGTDSLGLAGCAKWWLHMGGSRRSAEFLAARLEKEHGFDPGELNIIPPSPEEQLPAEPAPFPANVTYERKAWRWLDKNVHKLKGSVLFWNAGA